MTLNNDVREKPAVFTISRIFSNTIANFHFWAILVIVLLLILVYSYWPWQEHRFDAGSPWFSLFSYLDNLVIFEWKNHIVGILFLVPIIYATLIFSWQGSLVVTLLALARILSLIVRIWSLSALLTNIIILLLPLFLISIVALEIAWHRREQKIFAEREAERRLYTARVLESQENERRHIAQELHDDTIQTLLFIANRLQGLGTSGNKDTDTTTGGNTASIISLILNMVDGLRQKCLNLRPKILDNLGLFPALRWLVDYLNKGSNVKIQMVISGTECKVNPEAQANIFRIVQEGLNNIIRHSKATKATVNIESTEEFIMITLEDNGQGFQPPKQFHKLTAEGKLGLFGMKERIEFLGGTFQLNSSIGKGTTIQIKYFNHSANQVIQ